MEVKEWRASARRSRIGVRDDKHIAGYDELEGGNMAKWKEGMEMKRPA